MHLPGGTQWEYHVIQKHVLPIDLFVPENVHFTDFIPNETYYALLSSSQAVMCLTTRNHTMQRGACEALSMGKPIITSNWPLLKTYFHQGTIHVDNSAAEISAAVLKMEVDYQRYQKEIATLQVEQQQEWQQKIKMLVTLINQSFEKKTSSKKV